MDSWIGLTKPGSDWFWNDDTSNPLAHDLWCDNPQEPNGDGTCAHTQLRHGAMCGNDLNCDNTKKFLCEYVCSLWNN